MDSHVTTPSLGNRQQALPMNQKQQLADGVSNALSRQANFIEAERKGDEITLVSTFDDNKDLQQRLEVAQATARILSDVGVFTMTPVIRIDGNRLIVYFWKGADLYQTRVKSLPGFVLAKKTLNNSTNKMTGPWPVQHNPLMENLIFKPRPQSIKKHKATRNKQNKPMREETITEHVYVAEPINYATFDWNEIHRSKVEQQLAPKAKEETKKPSTLTLKEHIATVRLDPKDSPRIAGLFLKSINREISKDGSQADRRTRTAYQMWCHFMAAIGLVSQTQIIGTLDRLQNDRATTPCSMNWIWRVLSRETVDPEINVQQRKFGVRTQRTNNKLVKKWTVTVPHNGRTERIWQASSNLERAFHAAPKGHQAKAATPTLSKEGHYIGLTWS